VREVYAASLLQNVFDTDEYQQSFKLLRFVVGLVLLLLLHGGWCYCTPVTAAPLSRGLDSICTSPQWQSSCCNCVA